MGIISNTIYNRLLVEFDFLVDLDLAMWRYVRNNYKYIDYVDKELISLNDEQIVVERLLSRSMGNVLEYIRPKAPDNTEMYKRLIDKDYKELLKYSTVYDTFGLMITFLNQANAMDMNILCRNDLEADYIIGLNDIFKPKIIVSSRMDIDISKYTVIYTKLLAYCIEYHKLFGKNIYIANAGYNMDKTRPCIDVSLAHLFGDINKIFTIDLYKDIKYTIENRKGYIVK